MDKLSLIALPEFYPFLISKFILHVDVILSQFMYDPDLFATLLGLDLCGHVPSLNCLDEALLQSGEFSNELSRFGTINIIHLVI